MQQLGVLQSQICHPTINRCDSSKMRRTIKRAELVIMIPPPANAAVAKPNFCHMFRSNLSMSAKNVVVEDTNNLRTI